MLLTLPVLVMSAINPLYPVATLLLCTVEPPLTTTSKEQPHAIKRPRTQVRIETTMTSM